MPEAADDRAWFERSVMQVLPELVGSARRLTRNRHDAEDLVAEAIARAWLHRASLAERERFNGWIIRILTNLYLSQRRRDASHPPAECLDLTDGEEDSQFSIFERLHQPFLLWWSSPEQEFINKLVREDLVRAIDELAEPFRMTVILADVQGWSYSDIAESLGMPIGTVRSRLARGRAALQKSLWEHACDAGLRQTSMSSITPRERKA